MPGRKVARKIVGESAPETGQNGALSGREGMEKERGPGRWCECEVGVDRGEGFPVVYMK